MPNKKVTDFSKQGLKNYAQNELHLQPNQVRVVIGKLQAKQGAGQWLPGAQNVGVIVAYDKPLPEKSKIQKVWIVYSNGEVTSCDNGLAIWDNLQTPYARLVLLPPDQIASIYVSHDKGVIEVVPELDAKVIDPRDKLAYRCQPDLEVVPRFLLIGASTCTSQKREELQKQCEASGKNYPCDFELSIVEQKYELDPFYYKNMKNENVELKRTINHYYTNGHRAPFLGVTMTYQGPDDKGNIVKVENYDCQNGLLLYDRAMERNVIVEMEDIDGFHDNGVPKLKDSAILYYPGKPGDSGRMYTYDTSADANSKSRFVVRAPNFREIDRAKYEDCGSDLGGVKTPPYSTKYNSGPQTVKTLKNRYFVPKTKEYRDGTGTWMNQTQYKQYYKNHTNTTDKYKNSEMKMLLPEPAKEQLVSQSVMALGQQYYKPGETQPVSQSQGAYGYGKILFNSFSK